MARIPAKRVQATPPPSGGTASRRVLKSHRLSIQPDRHLVTTVARPQERALDREAVRRDDMSSAVRDAVAAAERAFERRLEAAVTKARDEGFAQGVEEGRSGASQQLDSQRAAMDLAASGFGKAWETFAEQSEPLVAELGFRIAESIIESPIPDDIRSVSTAALSNAMERIGDSGSTRMTLHPADFMMLTENGVVAQLSQAHPGVVWQTDAGLRRGDWEARSDSAVVRRVATELLQDLRERLTSLDAERGTA